MGLWFVEHGVGVGVFPAPERREGEGGLQEGRIGCLGDKKKKKKNKKKKKKGSHPLQACLVDPEPDSLSEGLRTDGSRERLLLFRCSHIKVAVSSRATVVVLPSTLMWIPSICKPPNPLASHIPGTGGKRIAKGRAMLTSYHLRRCHHQTHTHDPTPKTNTQYRRNGPPALTRQLQITQRRQYISQGARARRTNQLKHSPQIACNKAQSHRAHHQRRSENEMPIRLIRLLGEPVIIHHLPADEAFEGEGGEHVEAEAESGDVDEDVVGGEVVEDVSLGEGAEGEEAGEGHGEAGEHADGGAVVGYERETVEGWGAEGAVD